MTQQSTPLRPGDQLASVSCATRVVVVKAPAGDVVVACGGSQMVPAATAEKIAGEGTPATLLGKRYVDADDSIELLCTSAGSGSLSVNGAELSIKSPKPLPASD